MRNATMGRGRRALGEDKIAMIPRVFIQAFQATSPLKRKAISLFWRGFNRTKQPKDRTKEQRAEFGNFCLSIREKV